MKFKGVFLEDCGKNLRSPKSHPESGRTSKSNIIHNQDLKGTLGTLKQSRRNTWGGGAGSVDSGETRKAHQGSDT